jgi:hypothetical protein
MDKLLTLVLLFLCNSISAQTDTIIVKPDNKYSTKRYKIYYCQDISNKSYSDSLIIENFFYDILECAIAEKDNSIIVFYATDGTNKVTAGITLHFERYIIKAGKLNFDNKIVLPYGGSYKLRKFKYEIKGENIFFTKKNEQGQAFKYDMLLYTKLEDLKKIIYRDLEL